MTQIKLSTTQVCSKLREERFLRHWSQRDVADKIGTTRLTVSRWERGCVFPGAYFRQQLCTLFKKSAIELGLFPIEEEYLVHQNIDLVVGMHQTTVAGREEEQKPIFFEKSFKASADFPSLGGYEAALLTQWWPFYGVDVPDTGSLGGDLRAFIVRDSELILHSPFSRIIRNLPAETTIHSEFLQPIQIVLQESRRTKGIEILSRAILRGELAPDLDLGLALDFLVAPLYWRLVVTHVPTSTDYYACLVSMIIAALKV